MMSELNEMKTIQLALGKSCPEATLFRNNTGTGWQGSRVEHLQNGTMLIHNPRPLNAGLCKGSSDLIGFTEVVITADMIGKKVAVFTALEAKLLRRSKTSEEQLNFIRVVKEAGGRAGIVQTHQQGADIIHNKQ